MIDDQYTFNIAGRLNYDSKGQTFVANEAPNPYSCQGSQSNASKYYFVKGNGSANPKIVLLQDNGKRTPFLGTTDAVQEFTYEILSITEDDMVLRGTLSDGNIITLKFVNASISIKNIRLFLAGGSTKSWKLDPSPGANPIVAGIEANPTRDYAGGPLAPCQINDGYTFSSTDNLSVNFGGDALIYGGPGDYNCGDYQNFSGAYVLGPVQGSGAGSAQIVLANSSQFIGVMDRVQNIYRIIEISPTKLVLRIGDGSGPVQTLKFVIR